MKTKKIVADTMPIALKMVRQQLGDNAVIVNTRTIKTGGILGFFSKQKFEVTAYTTDDNQVSPEPKLPFKGNGNMGSSPKSKSLAFGMKKDEEQSVFHKNPQKLYGYYSQQLDASEKQPAFRSNQSSMDSSGDEVDDNQLLDELQNMKKMMVNFIMNEKPSNALPSGLNKWIDRLKKQGVDEKSIEFILKKLLKKHDSLADIDDVIIKKDLSSIIEETIKKRVPRTSVISDSTRLINVIGPTGVGKTTSIAKLATEQILKQKRKVAMITSDVYRIAAVEQLKTYAGILNVPIEVIRSKEELEVALNKLENYDLIYMDSTGRNYKEAKYVDSINEYLHFPVESDNYLVLSLTTKYEDMQVLLDEFKSSPVKKLILTKMDETTSYGAILNIAIKYPYQLAYITNGQSVPEDIATIDAKVLTQELLGVKN